MPSLKAIRTRIASVKNTQKITKAMKLVAAARLRRAQDNMSAARPYAKRVAEIIADISARSAGGEGSGDELMHPLLKHRPVQRARVIVVSSDRGLAGGELPRQEHQTFGSVSRHRAPPRGVRAAGAGRRASGRAPY